MLPEITVQNNGNFTVSVGSPVPISVGLGQFSLNNVVFTLQRTAGAMAVPSFAGTLSIPRLNRAAKLLRPPPAKRPSATPPKLMKRS